MLNNVQCTGTERRLLQCANSGPPVGSCSHTEDAGVTCLSGQPAQNYEFTKSLNLRLF